jgi:hypothetical protein
MYKISHTSLPPGILATGQVVLRVRDNPEPKKEMK